MATAQAVLRLRGRVAVRLVCKHVGQILSMQLALGLVCRLRSRHLLFWVRDAARRGDDSGLMALNARAADEASLFAGQVDTLVDQPMHKHLWKADYVLHCDASDNALATIIVSAPTQEDVRAPFYRRLLPHEAA